MLSKKHDIQKALFNEAVYNDDLNNYINLKHNPKENDNFKNAKNIHIYIYIHTYIHTYNIYIYTYIHTYI